MNRRMVVVGVIILLLVGVNVSGNIEIKESSTILDGNILYVGGSGPGNYTKIQDAIDDAYDGDTVFVYSGIYYENLIVNKSINISGENKATTIIEGTNELGTIYIMSFYVRISGFTIINDCDDYTYSSCIFIDDGDYCVIIDNIIYDSNGGLYSTSSDNIFIENNIISSNIFYGIYSVSCDNATIIGNTISLNGDNKRPNSGIYMIDSKYCNIKNNIITGNDYNGLSISQCRTIVIENNIIQENIIGLTFFNVIDVLIRYNNISENIFGIVLNEGHDNLIENNNFIKNTVHAIFDQPMINILFIKFYFEGDFNEWNNNYWDNNYGVFPKIIIGVISLLIPMVFFGIFGLPILMLLCILPMVKLDWNPASEPYDIEV